MSRHRVAPLLLALLVLAPLPVQAADGHEPLPVRNQMPMSAVLLDFLPLSAEGVGRGVVAGRVSYHIANMIAQEQESGVAMRMDLESHTVMVDLGYGVTDRVTLRGAIGYRWHVGGFLDGFIEEFEHAFGQPTPWSREHSEDDETDWWIRENGVTTFDRPEPANALTDLTLEVDWQASRQRGWLPAAALRLATKLPIAPTRDAMGSGGIDYGAGLALSWGYGWGATHVNADIARLSDHDGLAGTTFEDTRTLRTATLSQVVGIGQRWDAVLQVEARNNPYRTEIDSIVESLSAEAHLGVRRNLAGGGSWFLAITENTMDKMSPDFGVILAVELRRGVGH
jgi:hypothetical protein